MKNLFKFLLAVCAACLIPVPSIASANATTFQKNLINEESNGTIATNIRGNKIQSAINSIEDTTTNIEDVSTLTEDPTDTNQGSDSSMIGSNEVVDLLGNYGANGTHHRNNTNWLGSPAVSVDYIIGGRPGSDSETPTSDSDEAEAIEDAVVDLILWREMQKFRNSFGLN